jgi:hypothetical protein
MRLRQVRRYLLDFKEYLINKKKYSPMNVALKMSAVKSFYSAFEIDLPRNLLKEKNVHPLRENSNNNFTKKHIQQMAIYAPSLRNRAIILTMKSRGLSRRETIDLDYRQFREGYDILSQVTTISMRREKVGLDFVTFIDPEGTLAIIDYLKSVGRISKDGVFDSKYDALPIPVRLNKKEAYSMPVEVDRELDFVKRPFGKVFEEYKRKHGIED